MRHKPIGFYVVAMLIALTALVWFRQKGPQPRNDASHFSAVRAHAMLRQLLGDGKAHPIGSGANQQVRDRILAELRARGYAPEVQRQAVCNGRAECATVENIIAVLPGKSSSGAIMVACHYDSVPAGPGAGDDMSGVVIALELATLAKTLERRNDIIFLIDDGEEAGLFGAEAFVRHHPLARNVAAVINVESRGTSGPSHMFETSVDHGWLIDIMRSWVSRPSSTSIFYSIYQRLPNDTDLTVFRKGKMEGVNFAFIGDPLRYHTPQDSSANLSPRTLQHQGDNAWEMLQGLVRHDLHQRGGGERSYFDVLNFFLISWPTSWNLAIFIAVALIFILVAKKRYELRSGLWRAIAAVTATLVVSFALAIAVSKLLEAPTTFVASPLRTTFAGALIALAVALVLRGFVRCSAIAFLLSSGAVSLVLALLSVALFPGGAYVWLASAFGTTVALALYREGSTVRSMAAALAAILPTAIVSLPIILLLPDGMGIVTLPIITLLAMLVSLQAAAFVQSRREAVIVAIVPVVAALGFAITAMLTPNYTETEPRPLNVIRYHDADNGQASWLTSRSSALPSAFQTAAKWEEKSFTPFRGLRTTPSYHRAAASGITGEAPQLQILKNELSGSERHITARIHSPRGAYKFTLMLDTIRQRYISAAIDGVAIPPLDARYWRGFQEGSMRFGARGLDGDGVTLQLRLRGTEAVTGYLYDTSFGVASDQLTSQRSPTESTLQDGDVTIVKREIRF